MRLAQKALWLIGVMAPITASAQTAEPPTLDCALGFDGLQAAVHALPGGQFGQEHGFELATVSVADVWIAQISFTAPGHAAYPAVTLRTLRKQVTGVWTADSKGCGYGDHGQFAALMADMKSGDTQLTNASRAGVESKKQSQSPLDPAP